MLLKKKKSGKRNNPRCYDANTKSDFNLKSSLNDSRQVFWLPPTDLAFPSFITTVTFWERSYSDYSCRHSFGFTPNSFLIRLRDTKNRNKYSCFFVRRGKYKKSVGRSGFSLEWFLLFPTPLLCHFHKNHHTWHFYPFGF